MASTAMMIGGAILNAATFTSGNYLTKYLSGDDGKAALEEKTRHDKALEAYQAAMAKYTTRPHQASRLDRNQQENKRTSEAELHEHRLRIQTL